MHIKIIRYFFKEKDERDKNGKAKAKENGKTYVWEIEEVIHQSYKERCKMERNAI